MKDNQLPSVLFLQVHQELKSSLPESDFDVEVRVNVSLLHQQCYSGHLSISHDSGLNLGCSSFHLLRVYSADD